jgi:hypothetical protein
VTYKKVSIVLGALALMIAIGFGTSQSYAGEAKVILCHESENGKVRTISVGPSAVADHLAHGDEEASIDVGCVE